MEQRVGFKPTKHIAHAAAEEEEEVAALFATERCCFTREAQAFSLYSVILQLPCRAAIVRADTKCKSCWYCHWSLLCVVKPPPQYPHL